MARLSTAWQALTELGPHKLALYAVYQLGLHSGHYRRLTSPGLAERAAKDSGDFFLNLHLPDAVALRLVLDGDSIQHTLDEAGEIVGGQVRLFGAAPVPLQLNVPGALAHWTAYELGQVRLPGTGDPGLHQTDIKMIWEPARFSWVYPLGRAYRLTGDERYASAFWEKVEQFLDANPPYFGPNWASAQEVGLRLIAFTFGLAIFASSPAAIPVRREQLAAAIAVHAARIPPTLVYGRAQNNNHLLSEAAALYTTGSVLPQHPRADHWRELGWKWFNAGLQTQIDPDGCYSQQSTNYHRLMLQLATWFQAIAAAQDQPLPQKSLDRLAAAVHWLAILVDPQTGRVPNLGPNDGAYIQPLSACPFEDHRPVLQAASQAFLGCKLYPSGTWDEAGLWLSGKDQPPRAGQLTLGKEPNRTPHILNSPNGESWAYLRAAQFHGRPGHADQLHLDLWWHGYNLAQDAGTYFYNAAPPWDNALTNTSVHNTVTVNGLEQMRRQGRFLYLDWAQATIVEAEPGIDGWRRLVAHHGGYRRLGVIHQRSVTSLDDGWLVEDLVRPDISRRHTAQEQFSLRLHWLLPDWPWEIHGTTLTLESPEGRVEIRVEGLQGVQADSLQACLGRAGELLAGKGEVSPVSGWVSPTYAVKLPAISFSVSAVAVLPGGFSTRWRFPLE